MLRQLVARMQRRKLDRNARPRHQVAALRGLADRSDRVSIGEVIRLGVGGGAGGLAQHVVRVAIALAFGLAGPPDRLLDGLAEHEVPAEHAHRLEQRLAQDRLAQTVQQARQPRPGVGLLLEVRAHHPTGQHQPPGRGVDQERAAAAEMARPFAGAQLVADQPVGGVGVGDAQQRLGEAHQHDALARAQLVFVQECLDARAGRRRRAGPARPARARAPGCAPWCGRRPRRARAARRRRRPRRRDGPRGS